MPKVVKICCRECKKHIDGRKVKMGARPVLAGSPWATCRDCRDAPSCEGCYTRLSEATHKRNAGLCDPCHGSQVKLGLVGAA